MKVLKLKYEKCVLVKRIATASPVNIITQTNVIAFL